MSSRRPYYRRRVPVPQNEDDYASDGTHVDFSTAHLPPYGTPDAVAAAAALFDRRAAAVVRAAVSVDGAVGDGPIHIFPVIQWEESSKTTVDVGFNPFGLVGVGPPITVGVDHSTFAKPDQPWFQERDLLELKWYGSDAPTIYIVRSKCLAAMAYLDYFPSRAERGRCLRALVSAAVTQAHPGWCGTFGPNITDLLAEAERDNEEGNYDMTQMSLIPLAYQYYDTLTPLARDLLITQLLAHGRIRRPGLDDSLTSGPVQDEWRNAGTLAQGETENHILMILTTRYLCNQLLYQRTGDSANDNRRNGSDGEPSCLELVLDLLRNVLVDDFSEYNAKSYQEETRWALVNLCTYAYDHEVRLAARAVLDYVAARVAVSSCDLRRMVPFRRRNEGANISHSDAGFMTVGLLDWESGADRMTSYFALQAGNLRAFEHGSPLHRNDWGLGGGGQDLVIEVLSDYRVPEPIEDLFVTDAHRRFYQRLRRDDQTPGTVGRVAAGSGELSAGSPSYLITAGGEAATWAIDPRRLGVTFGSQSQQLGVGVTTSFMPTGEIAPASPSISLGTIGVPSDISAAEAAEMIQFGAFTSEVGIASNYGVAPDFACGHQTYLPDWVLAARDSPGYVYVDGAGMIAERPAPPGFIFVDRGSPFAVTGVTADGQPVRSRLSRPGFFLAIYQETDGGFGLLEAFDTWLHPDAMFADFKARVLARSGTLSIQDNVPTAYQTYSGTSLHFTIWATARTAFISPDEHPGGSRVEIDEYGANPRDGENDAGNAAGGLVHGTVLDGAGDGRVQITNGFTGESLILDLSDAAHPTRISNGVVERAGDNQEVWVDFEWSGPSEGDAYRPFTGLPDASTAVADGGVVKIIPGATADRSPIGANKRMTLVAPIGGVVIGGEGAPPDVDDVAGVDDGVWVDFEWTGPDGLAPYGNVLRPYASIADAAAAVAPGALITIMPGSTADRRPIGTDKRMILSAPLGHVTIGRPVPAAVPQLGGVHPV